MELNKISWKDHKGMQDGLWKIYGLLSFKLWPLKQLGGGFNQAPNVNKKDLPSSKKGTEWNVKFAKWYPPCEE